ncbi:hypothetical protein [Rhodoblastus sp.]|uniref:hypothetical protein n=1 Tax=Rhodoblastus sp. TaxID=1962975 RepID=UPI00260DA2EC|nr:hypothetical protein [Rhodoblastus sp.]
MFDLIYGFIVSRLSERSTWAGIISTLGARIGLHFTGAQETDAINAALAIVALVVAFVPEKPADHDHPPLV